MDLDNFLEQERRNREIRQQARQKPTRVKPAAPIRRGPSGATSRPTQRPPIQEFRPEPRSRTKPAATAKPAIKQNTKQYPQAVTPSSSRKPGAIKRDIDKALVPYIDRDRSEPKLGRFSGLTEQEFVNESQQTHERIRRMQGMSIEDKAKEVAKGTGLKVGADDDAITQFIKEAEADRFGGRKSAEIKMAVPHTGGRENLMRTLLNNSGRETEFFNADSVQATDLRSSFNMPNDTLIDVQDMFPREELGLGVLQNLNQDRAIDEWLRAGDNESILDISRRMSERARRRIETRRGPMEIFGADKLLQGRSEFAQQFPKDKNMRVRPNEFGKDFLVGGKYTPPTTNAIGSPNQGAFDPQMFSRGYALDLDQTREIILPMKKGDLSQLDITPSIQGGAFKLQIPASRLKDVGGGEAVRNHVFSPEVQRVLKQDYGADFYAGMGTKADGDSLIKGAVKGRFGGLANAAFNGASRETGRRIAKGDYVGAATEFGTNYAIGAAADVGLRKAGQAILTRLPAALAKGAASTVSSGGWAAPMAAAYTAYEVADGAVEGFTGKGLSTRMEEASDDAVTSAYERRFNQPAPTGGFVPKDKPQVKPEVKREPLSLEQINNAVEATKGLAPEAEAAPAQITQATPMIDKPDAGNFVNQWTNKVKSWFK